MSGQLVKLTALYIYNNRLSESVPSSYAKLTNLKELDLDGNSLSRVFPYERCSLPSFEFLLSSSLTHESTQNGAVTNLTALLDSGSSISTVSPVTAQKLKDLGAVSTPINRSIRVGGGDTVDVKEEITCNIQLHHTAVWMKLLYSLEIDYKIE